MAVSQLPALPAMPALPKITLSRPNASKSNSDRDKSDPMMYLVTHLAAKSSTFKTIKKKIDHYYIKDQNDPTLNFSSSEERNFVLKGHMQSGKTAALLSTAFYLAKFYGFTTIIIIQNNLDALTQLVERAEQLVGEIKATHPAWANLNDILRGRNIPVDDLTRYITPPQPGSWKKFNPDAQVIVCLRSVTDIAPLSYHITTLEKRRFALLVDESDFLDSNADAQVQSVLDVVKQFTTMTMYISATPLTTLVKEDVPQKNIIHLAAPPHYKDLSNMVFYPLNKEAVYSRLSNIDPLMTDDNLMPYLTAFSQRKLPTEEGKILQPCIALLRFAHSIEPQRRVAKYVAQKWGDKVLAITYNGGSDGIGLYGDALGDKPVLIGNQTTEVCPALVYRNGIETKQNYHYIQAGMYIGHVLTFLMENGGVEKFPRIAIMAGVLADRGVTFASSNYKECLAKGRSPWHLTEMYYLASKTTTQANLIQGVGRACGIFPDTIVPKIFSNAVQDIVKAYLLQNELIERAETYPSDEIDAPIATYRVVLPKMEISQEKIPARRITPINVPVKLNKVSDDSVYGGHDWSSMTYNCGENMVTLLPPKENIRIYSPAKEEAKTLWDKAAKAFRKRNTIVHRLLNLFIKHDFAELSIDTIKETCGINFKAENYTIWDADHHKYKIIEPGSTPRHFRVREETKTRLDLASGPKLTSQSEPLPEV
jgi:hypothetical protein